MKHYSLLILAMTAVNCGPLVTEPMPDIPETVEYDTVRIEYGDDDLVQASQPLTMHPQALVGDASLIALLAQGVVRGTNRIIRDQLILIDIVTKFPVTEWDDGLWVWDNAASKRADERFSRFEIRDEGEGQFAYLWRVGNTPDEMLEVFSGNFTPRAREDGEQRGRGLLRFHFDNIRAVDPESDAPQGRAAIAFRAVGGVRQVRVATYDLVERGTTEPKSSLYEYVQFPDNQGRFKFGTRTDFLGDGEPRELLAIDAGWNASREGRAKARLSGGSLEVNEVILDECWDRAAKITFADATPDIPGNYEDGAPDGCAAGLREIDLAPPEFMTPVGDPEIPGEHPDER